MYKDNVQYYGIQSDLNLILPQFYLISVQQRQINNMYDVSLCTNAELR